MLAKPGEGGKADPSAMLRTKSVGSYIQQREADQRKGRRQAGVARQKDPMQDALRDAQESSFGGAAGKKSSSAGGKGKKRQGGGNSAGEDYYNEVANAKSNAKRAKADLFDGSTSGAPAKPNNDLEDGGRRKTNWCVGRCFLIALCCLSAAVFFEIGNFFEFLFVLFFDTSSCMHLLTPRSGFFLFSFTLQANQRQQGPHAQAAKGGS